MTMNFDLERQTTDRRQNGDIGDGDLDSSYGAELNFAGQTHCDVAINGDDDHRPDADQRSRSRSSATDTSQVKVQMLTM